jgi:hypothetical protein
MAASIIGTVWEIRDRIVSRRRVAFAPIAAAAQTRPKEIQSAEMAYR